MKINNLTTVLIEKKIGGHWCYPMSNSFLSLVSLR